MANELLDFVMSLVRDPDAAARYAADPLRALADAHLTGVTSADVNSLIPVVSESLSMSSPVYGTDAVPDANVWSSGAATAAFDAFSGLQPPPVVVDAVDSVLETSLAAPVDTAADLVDCEIRSVVEPVLAPELDVHDVVPAADRGPVELVSDHPVDDGWFDDF